MLSGRARWYDLTVHSDPFRPPWGVTEVLAVGLERHIWVPRTFFGGSSHHRQIDQSFALSRENCLCGLNVPNCEVYYRFLLVASHQILLSSSAQLPWRKPQILCKKKKKKGNPHFWEACKEGCRLGNVANINLLSGAEWCYLPQGKATLSWWMMALTCEPPPPSFPTSHHRHFQNGIYTYCLLKVIFCCNAADWKVSRYDLRCF